MKGKKKYSETGQFTPQQRKLAKEIASRIKKLRESGCIVFGKQFELVAYLSEDFENSTEGVEYRCDMNHPVPLLNCGDINDSGADDCQYFIQGYIEGE